MNKTFDWIVSPRFTTLIFGLGEKFGLWPIALRQFIWALWQPQALSWKLPVKA